MAITKIYKGTTARDDILKIYKDSELLWEKQTVPDTSTCLTFQSANSFTLKTYNNIKNWNGTLYYWSGSTWVTWSGTTTLSSVNNKIYIRGTGNTYITGSYSSNYRWVLTGSNIECIGNIENLLNYQIVEIGNHPTMATSCYRNMFSGCTSLTTAPELPATTLTSHCYYMMFYGCTSLTTAPKLPATTLATACYAYMFNNCTRLKVSATRTGIYQRSWRIPTSGTGVLVANATDEMLKNTGGTYVGKTTSPYDVSINTIYYVENTPV